MSCCSTGPFWEGSMSSAYNCSSEVEKYGNNIVSFVIVFIPVYGGINDGFWVNLPGQKQNCL